MDMTASIAPRSDQLNADEIHAPVTYTIREVVQGKAEQPFDFMLVETDRAFRPGVTMRRLIVAAWGPDTKTYAGRLITLYRDPDVKFGGSTVGGIRISHMSHIDKPVSDRFQVTRGKRAVFTVDPISPTVAKLHALRNEYRSADDARKAEITAEVAALANGDQS